MPLFTIGTSAKDLKDKRLRFRHSIAARVLVTVAPNPHACSCLHVIYREHPLQVQSPTFELPEFRKLKPHGISPNSASSTHKFITIAKLSIRDRDHRNRREAPAF